MTENRGRAPQSVERKLLKALGYINDIDLFLNETDRAVPLLFEVFEKADTDLKDEIIFLLGTIAQRKVCDWLYAVMAAPGQTESTRHSAALQIGVTAALSDDTGELSARLLADTQNTDPVLRRLADIALGRGDNQREVTGFTDSRHPNDPVVR